MKPISLGMGRQPRAAPCTSVLLAQPSWSNILHNPWVVTRLITSMAYIVTLPTIMEQSIRSEPTIGLTKRKTLYVSINSSQFSRIDCYFACQHTCCLWLGANRYQRADNGFVNRRCKSNDCGNGVGGNRTSSDRSKRRNAWHRNDSTSDGKYRRERHTSYRRCGQCFPGNTG